MAELTDKEIEAALERGRDHFAARPIARSARYDRDRGRIVLDLENGCSFVFPPRLIQGLEGCAEDLFAAVVVSDDGYALRWDAADVDITVGGLLSGRFGSEAHMRRLALPRSSSAPFVEDEPEALAS